MNGLREVFDELLEPVYFEGSTHDDQHVRSSGNIDGLNRTNVVPQWM